MDIWFEYQKDGKDMKVPAYRWMRDVKTKKEAPPMTWVFTGSKVEDDNSYAANATGCLVGVINNECCRSAGCAGVKEPGTGSAGV